MVAPDDTILESDRTIPLSYYLQATVEERPTDPPRDYPALDPLTSTIERCNFFESVLHDTHFPHVNAFLLGGIDVNVRRPGDGATVLHIAAAGTIEDTRGLLHKHRSDEDVFARQCTNQIIISFLVDRGADVDACTTEGGITPLMLAAVTQNVRVLQLLLQKGARLSVRDSLGHTCLSYAAFHPHVLHMLWTWCGDAVPELAGKEGLLHQVCHVPGHCFSALYLLEELHLDVNATDMEGEHEVSSSLLQEDPLDDISVCVPVKDGSTPLHCAIGTGDLSLVRALLSKRADPHLPNAMGVTPLQMATRVTGRAASLAFRGTAFSVRHRDIDISGVRGLLDDQQKYMPVTYRMKKWVHMAQTLALIVNWMEVLCMIASMTLPYALFYRVCCLTNNFYVLLAVICLMLTTFRSVQLMEARLIGRRPLRSFGMMLGFFIVQGVCFIDVMAPLCLRLSLRLSSNPYVLGCWCAPIAVATVVLLLSVMVVDPGKVHSTAGQRKGIYASITQAKGTPSGDVINSIDLPSMVKKPLRAQRCPHMQYVILRYDHYCTYLASCVGARNHRAFVYLHVAALLLLGIVYLIATEYRIIVHSNTEAALRLGGLMPPQSDALQEANSEVPIYFMTPYLRFVYMMAQVALPVAMALIIFALLAQYKVISKGFTWFEYNHALDVCSTYCFKLGQTTYSLFDFGWKSNMFSFFCFGERLDAQVHRVPKINPRLQRIVEDHQRWNVGHTDCCQHSHNDHAHNVVTQANGGATAGATVPDSVAHSIIKPMGIAPAAGTSETQRPAAALSLANHLFQVMLRNGATNVGSYDSFAQDDVATIGKVTEDEWDAAVQQAQNMFNYFKSTMQTNEQSPHA